MIRALHVDPSDAAPIWSQIEAAIRRLVASGALSAGDALPSVRDLARDLSVNPATVAKAYQRLTEGGVLAVRRGEGTYVSDAPPRIGRAERVRVLRDGATRYASLAVTIGADTGEAATELESAFRKMRHGAKGGEQ